MSERYPAAPNGLIDDLPTSSRAADVKAALAMVDREREERERLRQQLAGAVEALESLRAAWNEHMKTCPQHAKLPMFDEIEAWMTAPSNTASGGQ